MARSERMAKIAQTEGWDELKEEFKRKKERQLKALISKFVNGNFDQREADWHRGFWAGCEWLLANPDMAEKSVERALRTSTALKEGEVDVAVDR